jgi:hypothetical protein
LTASRDRRVADDAVEVVAELDPAGEHPAVGVAAARCRALADDGHRARSEAQTVQKRSHRILTAIRAYWERTGYLPRLERDTRVFWLNAPDDVAVDWMLAFGTDRQGSVLF